MFHDLIAKLMRKRGIDSVNDLDEVEKKTFDDWQKVLSKEELTLPDVKEFCASQITIIENKWSDYNLEDSKKQSLIPYHTVYKSILKAIDSPKEARQALEKNLMQLVEQ